MTPACTNCGNHVTESYARVFGDRDNEVEACPECATYAFIMKGGAAGRQVE